MSDVMLHACRMFRSVRVRGCAELLPRARRTCDGAERAHPHLRRIAHVRRVACFRCLALVLPRSLRMACVFASACLRVVACRSAVSCVLCRCMLRVGWLFAQRSRLHESVAFALCDRTHRCRLGIAHVNSTHTRADPASYPARHGIPRSMVSRAGRLLAAKSDWTFSRRWPTAMAG